MLISKSVLQDRITSPFAAKALACSYAVRMGVDMGFEAVEIEGDALTVIKKVSLMLKIHHKYEPIFEISIRIRTVSTKSI